MPEGDTIFRAASVLREWLVGRQVTAVQSKLLRAQLDRMVGSTVEAVEAKGKHLLLRCSNGLVLHTHMRMTGSWHVYSDGDRWQQPAWKAKVVLHCGERLAVCFSAPVVELLAADAVDQHAALRRLGPDVLALEPPDDDEVTRRWRSCSTEATAGDLLLDQSFVSGIGNIYRCEVLFEHRVHPSAPAADLEPDTVLAMVRTARRLMAQSAQPGADAWASRARSHPAVYRRTGRPCPRCGTSITSALMGRDARRAYWCPRCQPVPAPSA